MRNQVTHPGALCLASSEPWFPYLQNGNITVPISQSDEEDEM